MSLSDNYLYQFEKFQLNLREKFLVCENKQISLTPKTFEMLSLFLENSGKLITKEELLDKIWTDSFVEESNLTFTIRQLRKVLDDDAHAPKFIETIPRRGYRFIANVKQIPIKDNEISDNIVSAIPLKKSENVANSVETIESVSTKSNSFHKVISQRPVLFLLLGTIFIFTISLFLWGLSSPKTFFSGSKSFTNFKAEKLTETGSSRYASISPDGTLVSYITQVNGLESLWLRQLKSNSNLQILAPSNEVFRNIRFSADGQSIFFIKGKRGDKNSLYNLPIIGGVPQKITENVEDVFAPSPDGKKIAYVKMIEPNENWSLLVANVDGSEEISVANRPIAEPFWAVSWSFDNKTMAYAVGETRSGKNNVSLNEYDFEAKSERSLTDTKFFQVKDLGYFPNTQELIFTGREKLSDQNELWKVSLKNGEVSKFSNDTNYYTKFNITSDGKKIIVIRSVPNFKLWMADVNNPNAEITQVTESYRGLSWSSNNQIAYASSIGGNDDIWTMNPDGSEPKQLTFTNSTEFLPHFSADGKSLVYVSSNSGVLHIWRMDADGSNQRQLTNGAGESNPIISPDGKWLIYETSEDELIKKMPLDGGEPIKITAEHALRSALSPDGKFVVFYHPSNKKSVESNIWVVSFATGEKFKEFKVDGKNISGWHFRWASDSKGFYYASYDDASVANIRYQSLENEKTEKMTNFTNLQIFDFDISPDNKKFAVIRGSWSQDVLLLKDFD